MGELEIFGLRLKQLREEMGLNQADFSKLIGSKQQTLSGYERGIMKPPLDVAKNIAKKCNVSLDWLCGLTDKQNYNDELKTYSDIIQFFIKLEDIIHIRFETKNKDHIQNSCKVTISIANNVLYDFFSDWERVRGLEFDCIIDSELYDLWIENALKKFSIPIE